MFSHRPYSLPELEYLEQDMMQHLQLSHVFAHHSPCEHRYRVKKNGRKEKQILINNTPLSSQSCSICFKLRNKALLSPDLIQQVQLDESTTTDLSTVSLERKILFYQWLYRHELIYDQHIVPLKTKT